MKVYVITYGCYSEYHICSVTLDKEQAEMLKEKYSSTRYDANIEIYDTDNNDIVLRFKKLYKCWYNTKYSRISIDEKGFEFFEQEDLEIKSYMSGLYTCVLADSVEDALKIASDKFSKYRAEKMGM